MIDIVTIENRIKECQLELAVLRQNHDSMMAAFQQQQQAFNQQVANNQARFQQLTGALTELEELKKGMQPKGQNNEPTLIDIPAGGNAAHPATTDRVPHSDRRNRDHRRADMGH